MHLPASFPNDVFALPYPSSLPADRKPTRNRKKYLHVNSSNGSDYSYVFHCCGNPLSFARPFPVRSNPYSALGFFQAQAQSKTDLLCRSRNKSNHAQIHCYQLQSFNDTWQRSNSLGPGTQKNNII
jgi:hypothetical protein